MSQSLIDLFNDEFYTGPTYDNQEAMIAEVEAIVVAMYVNIYGVPAEEIPDGFTDWWVGEVLAGRVEVSNILETSLGYAAAGKFAAEEVQWSESIAAGAVAAQAYIDDLEEGEVVDILNVKIAVAQAIESLNEGQTFALTSDADELTGTFANDIFTATAETFNSDDILDGGEGGADKLILDLGDVNISDAIQGATVSGIENIYVTASDTDVDMDITHWEGVNLLDVQVSDDSSVFIESAVADQISVVLTDATNQTVNISDDSVKIVNVDSGNAGTSNLDLSDALSVTFAGEDDALACQCKINEDADAVATNGTVAVQSNLAQTNTVRYQALMTL
jgi:hypothetical protein